MKENVDLITNFGNLFILLLGVLLLIFSFALVLISFGLFVLNVSWITVNITLGGKIFATIVSSIFVVLGGYFIYVGIKMSDIKLKGKITRQKEQFATSMELIDKDGAFNVMKERAIDKAKSNDIDKALVGVQEIEAIGAVRPFGKGFNALAHELARRRSWRIRIPIFDALSIIIVPIREQLGNSRSIESGNERQ